MVDGHNIYWEAWWSLSMQSSMHTMGYGQNANGSQNAFTSKTISRILLYVYNSTPLKIPSDKAWL